MATQGFKLYDHLVLEELERRRGWGRMKAEEAYHIYKLSLKAHGRRARDAAPRMGLLKKDWGAVRAAILEVNDRQRSADPRPEWARVPDAPDWMILSMKPGTSIWGSPGWFAEVEGRSGNWFAFSKLEGEAKWYADSHFGPKMEPFFSHGEGDRTVGKQSAKDPLNTYLNRAEDLASQGQGGPYDPRLLGPVDAPGQGRLFNPECPECGKVASLTPAAWAGADVCAECHAASGEYADRHLIGQGCDEEGREGNPPTHCDACGRPLMAHQDLVIRGEKGWHQACRRGNPGYSYRSREASMDALRNAGATVVVAAEGWHVTSPDGTRTMWIDLDQDGRWVQARGVLGVTESPTRTFRSSKEAWAWILGRKGNPDAAEWDAVARMSPDEAREFLS